MTLSLSGTLKDPYGDALPGARIRFDAVLTSSSVLQYIRAEATTDSGGDYALQVQEGRYNVYVLTDRSYLTLGKNVEVRADTSATTLNELLIDWQGEQDLTPAIVIEFRALTAEARGYRDEAESSASAASDSEINAAQSESNASTSASNAADSEANAGQSATAAAGSATAASNSAGAAATSESNASGSESAAASSATSAADSADAAATSENNASTSATNAAESETGAGDSAAEAMHWAQYPNDTPVPEGNGSQYSAAHWAEVSRQRAVNAMVAQGAWDASTGTLPAEPAGASYWLVTGAASGEIIGGVEYRNKDMLLWTPNESGGGGTWSKIDNTDSVASVAGKTGAVTLVPGDAGADPAGSAAAAEQAAKDYAVQRSNHTGTQPLSSISGAGTAAGADTGTGAGQVPTTADADARYAVLAGPNSFDTMLEVNGVQIVASGSNTDGNWTRFSDGTLIQYGRHVSFNSTTDTVMGPLYRSTAGQIAILLPQAFFGNRDDYSSSVQVGGTSFQAAADDLVGVQQVQHESQSEIRPILVSTIIQSGTLYFTWQAKGRWKA
ncbi:prophage tail fiber N-terminal domain-containing protein [Halomonas sp. V046]|uniref:prophage tail fiber N-terminal domain-containing protein n=1 Tax=Halomonas sp. V046 TaxID=3459611 RepID=UPI004044A9AA